MRPQSNRTRVLAGRAETPGGSLCPRSKKAAVYQPGREVALDTNPDGTAPELPASRRERWKSGVVCYGCRGRLHRARACLQRKGQGYFKKQTKHWVKITG